MPRSNRPRRPARRGPAFGGASGGDTGERGDFAHLRVGFRRTESRAGRSWTVQPIAPERALKPYTCPGCGRTIAVGVAHLAVWPADHLFGDDRGLEERRHWHEPCWRIA